MKFLSIWALPAVVFLIVLGLLAGLSTGMLPGIPAPAQRTVTVFYPPHSDSTGVSLFLQPPMASLQFLGGKEPLTLQFVNHTKKKVALSAIHVHPETCFAMAPVEPKLPTGIDASGSFTALFDLHFLNDEKRKVRDECLEPQPLALTYEWRTLTAAEIKAETAMESAESAALKAAKPNASAADRKAASRTRKAADAAQKAADLAKASAPPVVQQTVSTSPISLTTHRIHVWEQFFHAGGVILVPAILALITLLFQSGQRRRDDEQKEQERHLEAWKAILEGIVASIKKHYVPLSRKMDTVVGRIDANATLDEIVASMLVMRRQMELLVEENGGVYFRIKPGETLFSALSNLLWTAWYDAADMDVILPLVALLDLKDNVPAAKVRLALPASQAQFAQVLDAIKAQFDPAIVKQSDQIFLKRTRYLLVVLASLLNFESDRVMYPEWYDHAPKIDPTTFSEEGIKTSPLLDAEKGSLKDPAHDYFATISGRFYPTHQTRNPIKRFASFFGRRFLNYAAE